MIPFCGFFDCVAFAPGLGGTGLPVAAISALSFPDTFLRFTFLRISGTFGLFKPSTAGYPPNGTGLRLSGWSFAGYSLAFGGAG